MTKRENKRQKGLSVRVSLFLSTIVRKCKTYIQFNILYDCGVFPEVTYADGAWEHTAATREEVYDYLRSLGHVDADKEERFRANCDKRMAQTEAGLWRYAYESQMYVLGWDPNQIDWDKAAHL